MFNEYVNKLGEVQRRPCPWNSLQACPYCARLRALHCGFHFMACDVEGRVEGLVNALAYFDFLSFCAHHTLPQEALSLPLGIRWCAKAEVGTPLLLLCETPEYLPFISSRAHCISSVFHWLLLLSSSHLQRGEKARTKSWMNGGAVADMGTWPKRKSLGRPRISVVGEWGRRGEGEDAGPLILSLSLHPSISICVCVCDDNNEKRNSKEKPW